MRLPPWFPAFLAEGADRCSTLFGALAEAGLSPRPVTLRGARMLVLPLHAGAPDPRYRLKVLSAHHDRVPGSPGALDNSAACLQLLRFAARAQAAGGAFNTVAVFTDREELGGGSPLDQGSYALGRALLAGEAEPPLVFSLDVTGRGDALCVSAAGAERLAVAPRLAGEVERARELAERALPGRCARAELPFSEDLGFLCAGVPAVTCTVLPRADVEGLRADPPRRPRIWGLLHGPDDRPDLYEDSAFELVEAFLDRLGSLREPAWIGASPKASR